MTLFGKTIVTFIFLGILGIGGYMYATRPIAGPSVSPVSESDTLPASSTDAIAGMNAATGSSSSDIGTASTSALGNASTSSIGTISYKITTGTYAEFTIKEVLRGKPFTVVGSTTDVSGGLKADMGTLADSLIGTIKINARTFKTDSSNRDNAVARFVLKSEDAGNEFITFEPKELSGFSADAAARAMKGESVAFKVKGDLTIAGIVKSTTFDAKFALAQSGTDAGKIKGVAEAKIKRSDFKLVIPNIPFVADVPDEFLIKINAVLSK